MELCLQRQTISYLTSALAKPDLNLRQKLELQARFIKKIFLDFKLW